MTSNHSDKTKYPTAHPTSVETANAANNWHPTHSPSPAITSESPWALVLDSLLRRVRSVHALWLMALSDMTLEQVNYVERDGVLPIAFTLIHMIRMEDNALVGLAGRPNRWDAEGWAARIGVTVDAAGRQNTVEEMMEERIGNYDEYMAFVREIFTETEQSLDNLDPDALGELIGKGGVFPPSLKNGFVHRVVRDEKLLRADGYECWIYQHGIRHLGELEHARALVGLGGLTS